MLARTLKERLRAWIEQGQSMAPDAPEPDRTKGQRSAMAGKYVLLYTYLENRFANTVVMTFSEIEDILGFRLPALARLSADWWTSPHPDTARPRFSDSWVLANRTARPNLQPLTVVFDRAS